MEGGNGVSMTHSSGVPYSHGTPRLPIHPQPNTQIRNPHTYTANAISSYANGHTLPTVHFTTTATQPGPQAASTNGGQVNNGFTAVGLHAPNGTSSPTNSNVPQPLPIQAIRPIQAVQPQVRYLFVIRANSFLRNSISITFPTNTFPSESAFDFYVNTSCHIIECTVPRKYLPKY